MEPQETDFNKLLNDSIQHSVDASLYGTSNITTTEGLWSQITNSENNVYKTPYYKLEERLDKLELDNKLLRLKILGLEGKFNQDEISNIRKMLISVDEAAKALADSIIENA